MICDSACISIPHKRKPVRKSLGNAALDGAYDRNLLD